MARYTAFTSRWTRHGALGAALLGILAVLALAMPRQALTGDETRYVLYAASILRHGAFEMPVPEWSALHQAANGTPAADLPRGGDGSVVMNPVYLSALLSPLSLVSPLHGPRLATLLAGLGGLAVLWRLCGAAAGPRAALLACAAAGFSIPLLPYLHLFYMETFVFSLVCLAWWRVQRSGQDVRADLVTGAVIAAIPIAHMRGSVVAAALYGFLLWPALSGRDLRRATLLAAPGAMGLALLVGLNLLVYGALTGPVNTARPPLPWAWTSVLPMQLFNVRHGLFAYAPVWVLGYAGLVAGALRGVPLAPQGVLLAAVAALTGVGVNPGECWPARFWVLSVPMLAVGLSMWLGRARGAMHVATLLLGAVTLLNSALFLLRPNSFLENRQSTVTYQAMFDGGLPAHFGLLLPVELPDPAQLATVAVWSAFFGALFLLGIAAAWRPRLGWAAAPMALVIAAGVWPALVRPVQPTGYALDTTDSAARILMQAPQTLAALQFGRAWETWNYDKQNLLDLDVIRADGTTVHRRLLANQVIALRCFGPVSSIRLSSSTSLDVAGQARFRLALYRPAPGLPDWAAQPGGGCG